MNSDKYCAGVLILCLWLNVVAAFAQTRGVGVRVKNEQTGKTEDVQLYKASYALVIGESDYTNGWQKLPGVRSDVEAVRTALEQQGFFVTTTLNAKRAELSAAIEKFINDYGYDYENRLLIYYAGHGYTQKSGAGYEQGFIVPSDAPTPKAGNEVDFRRSAISMDTIERYAQEINAKHALFVFDSCFSGSLITKTRGIIPPIITIKTTQPVRQFITAGSDDQEVPDVSVFRQQFVEGLKGAADRNTDGFVTATELADFLQDKVTRYTRGAQTPQYGKIRDARLDKGDFVFVLSGKANDSNVTNTIVQPDNPITAKDAAAVEREAWNDIKNSSSASDFRSFLQEFPNGANAQNAKIKLEQIVWDAVKDSADINRLQAYLDEFQAGANAPLARIKLRRLKENATNLNPQPGNKTQNGSNTNVITLNVKVWADDQKRNSDLGDASTQANGWTNIGLLIKKGQKIKISATGRVSLGNGNYSLPSGISSLSDKNKLLQREATGGLIAVIGDDNNDFIFIGSTREFTATRDGALFLGINEGELGDNSGAYDVVIEIEKK